MKQLTLALPCEFIKGYQSKSYTDSPSRMPKLGIIVTTSLDSSYTLLGLHKGASVIYTCLHTYIYLYSEKSRTTSSAELVNKQVPSGALQDTVRKEPSQRFFTEYHFVFLKKLFCSD